MGRKKGVEGLMVKGRIIRGNVFREKSKILVG